MVGTQQMLLEHLFGSTTSRSTGVGIGMGTDQVFEFKSLAAVV